MKGKCQEQPNTLEKKKLGVYDFDFKTYYKKTY